MSNKYFYDSNLGRYIQRNETYTGAHTKITSRHLENHELENIKIRQLERIAKALELIVQQIDIRIEQSEEQKV